MGTSAPLNLETRLAQLEQQVSNLARQNAQLIAQLGSSGPAPTVRLASLYTDAAGDWPAKPKSPGKAVDWPKFPTRLRFYGVGSARSAKTQADASFLPMTADGIYPQEVGGSETPESLYPEWCPRDQVGLAVKVDAKWDWHPIVKPPTFGWGKAASSEFGNAIPCKPCDRNGTILSHTETFDVLISEPVTHPTNNAVNAYPGVVVETDDVIYYVFVPGLSGGARDGVLFYISGGRRQVAMWGKQITNYTNNGRTVNRCDRFGTVIVPNEVYTLRYPCAADQYPYVFQDDIITFYQDDSSSRAYVAPGLGSDALGTIKAISGTFVNQTELEAAYPAIAKGWAVTSAGQILAGAHPDGRRFTLGTLPAEPNHAQTYIREVTWIRRVA